ncbi:MAG: zinc finger MYND domain-containing protein [Candidatus Paceibacterota bacterium]
METKGKQEIHDQKIKESKNDFQSSLATNNVLAYLVEKCRVTKPGPNIQKRVQEEMRHTNFTPNLKYNCLVCGKLDVDKRCGKCHAVHYCDEVCARKGWKYHKKQCGRNLFTVCVCCGQPDIRLLRSSMVDPPPQSELIKFPDFRICQKCPVRYCSDKCFNKFSKKHEKDCSIFAELNELCKTKASSNPSSPSCPSCPSCPATPSCPSCPATPSCPSSTSLSPNENTDSQCPNHR